MAHWNHRVVRLPDGGELINIICEVYYNEDGTPKMRNEGARIMYADDEDPKEILARFAKALEAPVLTPADFKD